LYASIAKFVFQVNISDAMSNNMGMTSQQQNMMTQQMNMQS